jgi:hypothetical protein
MFCLRRLAPFLLTAAALACRHQPRHQPLAPLRWKAIPDAGERITWIGYGVSFQTPVGATIIPDTSRFAGLPGAQISAFVRGGDLPDFIVYVSVMSAPPGSSLSAWVDSLRTARNKILNKDIAQLDPPTPRTVGTLPGLQLLPFCGDCEATEVYVQTDSFRVAFEYSLEGSTLDRVRQDSLYQIMLRSVHLR